MRRTRRTASSAVSRTTTACGSSRRGGSATGAPRRRQRRKAARQARPLRLQLVREGRRSRRDGTRCQGRAGSTGLGATWPEDARGLLCGPGGCAGALSLCLPSAGKGGCNRGRLNRRPWRELYPGALSLCPRGGGNRGRAAVHFPFAGVAPATHESSGVRAWPGCTDRRGAPTPRRTLPGGPLLSGLRVSRPGGGGSQPRLVLYLQRAGGSTTRLFSTTTAPRRAASRVGGGRRRRVPSALAS